MSNENGGASPAIPAEAGLQKSRSRGYRRAYHRAHYGTVSACLTRPEKAAFQEACRRLGVTQHAVIAELVADWMVLQGVFEYEKGGE